MIRRNKTFNLMIASLAVMMGTGTAMAEKLTVNQDNLRELLVQNNDQLKVQEENKKVAEYRLNAANAIYIPSLTFDSSYSQANQSLSGTQLGVSKTFSNKFTYNQILYANEKVKNNVRLALLSTYGSNIDYDRAYNDTIYQAYNSYYQAAKAKELLNISQKAVDQTKSRLNVTQQQLSGAVGDKAAIMIGNAKVQVMAQEQNLLKAKQNELMARKSLAVMLKKNADELDIKTTLTDEITKPENSKNYEIAKQNRVEYKQIALAKDVTNANKAIADAAYSLLPTVSLVGTYDIKNTIAPDFFSPTKAEKNSNTQDWMAAVNAQWIIFDGAKNANEALAQVAINRQNEINQDSLDDKVKLEVDNASLALDTAYDQIEVTREAMNISKDNLTIAQRLYNKGVGTEADLKDAETNYIQSSTNYINAYYDYKLALIGLKKALGQL